MLIDKLLDYVKYENNPVINSDLIPEGASKTDFRDPKIWEKVMKSMSLLGKAK